MKIRRIISLAPSNTEILFALGEGRGLVGVTEFCNYPPETESIDKIGGFSMPDIEKIVSLSPDLVLATDFHLEKSIISQLKNKGVSTYIVKAKTILDIPDAIISIGSLIGKEQESHKLAQDIQAQIGEIRDKTKDLKPEEKSKVCYICSHDPLRIAREACCVNITIELAGGINIGKEIEQTDLLNIITKDPDVIIVSSGHGETVDLLNYVKNEPILHKTSAYKSNRVYRARADLFARFGPRAVEGLREIAKLIHPEIFGGDK